MTDSKRLDTIHSNLKELDSITEDMLKEATYKNLLLRKGLRDTVRNYRNIKQNEQKPRTTTSGSQHY